MKINIYLILFLISRCLSFDLVLDKKNIDIECSVKKCLFKCCAKNEYINSTYYGGVCVKNDGEENLDFLDLQLYDDEWHSTPSEVTFKDNFMLKPNLWENKTFAKNSYSEIMLTQNTYLSQSGVLYLETPNSYERWTRAEDTFCIDYANDLKIHFWVLYLNKADEKNNYYPIALIVSSVFLVLLLIVYAILPELRNIGGLILMAYVISLLGAFLTLAAIQVSFYEDYTCLILTTLTYFFFMGAFSWMNVMSLDIWWTFRGYAKARPIHRRGEKFKFCMYCLYAWGIPMAMSIGFVVINQADLSDMPWFVKPQIPRSGCFLQGGQKFVYLYLPMLILILCNWCFYLMTAFNIWRLHKGTAVLNSPAFGNRVAHRSQMQRLSVYLKLSVVMGINWVLEVISSVISPGSVFWYLTDAYNLLIGFTIFVIFVCKKSVYYKLLNKYKTLRQGRLPKRTMTASTTLEKASQKSLQGNTCPSSDVHGKISNRRDSVV